MYPPRHSVQVEAVADPQVLQLAEHAEQAPLLTKNPSLHVAH